MDPMSDKDELSTFADEEVDERLRWRRVESEALAWCEPLARMIGHKEICSAIDVSGGQLTRELSPVYENRLSLLAALKIGRRTQHEKLARIIVCDGLGMRLPEWQKRNATDADELAALRTEVRELGQVGQLLIDRAKRRARGGP